MKKPSGNHMWGQMLGGVDTLKCFLHALSEICLIWEQCSQKWLKPLCSPCVRDPRGALPRGRRATLCCGLQRGSWGAEPRQPSQLSSHLWSSWRLPHAAVRCGNTSSCSWQFDVSLG